MFRTVQLWFHNQTQKEVQKHGHNSTSKQNLQKNCADKQTKCFNIKKAILPLLPLTVFLFSEQWN